MISELFGDMFGRAERNEVLDCLRRPFGNPLNKKSLPRSRPQLRFPVPDAPATETAWAVLAIQMTAIAVALPSCVLVPEIFPVVPVMAAIVLSVLCYYFRAHYLDHCTASPVPRRVADDFRRRGVLPVGVLPGNIFWAVLDATHSFLTYNGIGATAPGLFLSPAGSVARRKFLTTAAVVLVSLSGPCLFISGLFESVAGVSILASVIIAVVLFASAFPITLIACFIVASSILRGGFAIRRQATLAQYWEAFLADLDNSVDPLERNAFYLGKIAHDGSPVLFSRNSPKSHGHLQGPTGALKTTYFMFYVEQIIRRGWSVVVIDLKSQTYELLETLRVCNRRLGGRVPLWLLTNRKGDSSHLFSIFNQTFWKGLTPAQKTNVLLGAIAIALGRQYGMSWYGDAAYTLVDFVFQKYPDIGSFDELDRRMAYEMQHGKDPELSRQVRTDGEHARLVIRRLAKQEFLNPRPSHPKTAVDNSVELGKLFSSQGLLYCAFPTMLAPVESPEHARLITSALCTAANVLRNATRPVVLVIDEFPAMVAPGTIQLLLRQARSAGIHVILSNQTVADLETDGVDMTSTIEGNVAFQVWLQTDDRAGREQIRSLGGEILTFLEDVNTSTGGNGYQRSVTRKQTIVDRWPGTRVAEVSAKRNHFILRITDDKDYSQYGGLPFEAIQDWIMSEAEYERRKKSPWPAATAETIVIGKASAGRKSPAPPVGTPVSQGSPVLSTGTLGAARTRTRRAPKK